LRVFLDGHIHSRYSRATSQDMTVTSIARYAQIKGLKVVGTGDSTHPLWYNELKALLEESPWDGLYTLKEAENPQVYFMVSCEVHTLFSFEGKQKKIHHVIWMPSLEVAEQLNEELRKYGSLEADGRPTLELTPPELVELTLQVSEENVVFPAHAWTPWFSLFGTFSGFDRLEDCYQDKTSKIFALETGLSSDPPMNWRIKELDRLALVSNSDSHSYWPWRLGREANVLELKNLGFRNIVEAIKSKDPRRFLFTVETNPAYGKYHWTGHRACGVSLPAQEAEKMESLCPVCGRKMTKGVEQRVEELADRPAGFKPEKTPAYVHLLPLSEVIATALGADSLSSQRVWLRYNALVRRFGNEYTVLLDASYGELCEVVERPVAELIVRVREGRVTVKPGYDGVYGKLIVKEETGKPAPGKKRKPSLRDYM